MIKVTWNMLLTASLGTMVACGAGSSENQENKKVSKEQEQDSSQELLIKSELGSLNVTLQPFASTKGQVCYVVFDSEAAYPNRVQDAMASGCRKVEGELTVLRLEGFQLDKEYGIAVIHDEDMNEEMTMTDGEFAFPKEGFGHSRNPPLTPGSPSYKDIKFTYTEETANGMAINLIYALKELGISS